MYIVCKVGSFELLVPWCQITRRIVFGTMHSEMMMRMMWGFMSKHSEIMVTHILHSEIMVTHILHSEIVVTRILHSEIVVTHILYFAQGSKWWTWWSYDTDILIVIPYTRSVLHLFHLWEDMLLACSRNEGVGGTCYLWLWILLPCPCLTQSCFSAEEPRYCFA